MPERGQVQQSYNRLSRWYDLFSGSEARVSRRALDLFKPQPGECLLEIGFGTGQCLVALAQQTGAYRPVTGIDLSPGMARVARARLRRANLVQRARLTLGDAVCLPYPSGCFDGLFCAFTLELFAEKEIPAALAEWRRVLRPGGQIAVVSLYRPPAPNRAVKIYEWFHRQMPGLVDCRSIPVQAVIVAAGFVIREAVTQSIWGLPAQIVVGVKPAHAAPLPGAQPPPAEL